MYAKNHYHRILIPKMATCSASFAWICEWSNQKCNGAKHCKTASYRKRKERRSDPAMPWWGVLIFFWECCVASLPIRDLTSLIILWNYIAVAIFLEFTCTFRYQNLYVLGKILLLIDEFLKIVSVDNIPLFFTIILLFKEEDTSEFSV